MPESRRKAGVTVILKVQGRFVQEALDGDYGCYQVPVVWLSVGSPTKLPTRKALHSL